MNVFNADGEEDEKTSAGEDSINKEFLLRCCRVKLELVNTVRHPHTNHELNLTVFSRVILGSVTRCISASRAYAKLICSLQYIIHGIV